MKSAEHSGATKDAFFPILLRVIPFVMIALSAAILLIYPLLKPPIVEFNLPEGQPEEVLRALKSKSVDELNNAIDIEQNSYLRAPLRGDALRNLIVLYELTGNSDMVERVSAMAAKQSLHNLPLQMTAVSLAVKRGDFEEVFFRLDGLIRSKQKLSDQLLAAVVDLARNNKAMPALAKTLATSPPWRGKFIDTLANSTTDNQIVYRVFSALRKTNAPPTNGELRSYLFSLIKNKNYDTAYFVWLDFLSADKLRKTGLLYDGVFDFDPDNLFFGWTADSVANANIDIVSRVSGGSDRVLQVSFSGYDQFFGHMQQYLNLPPAVYTMTGERRAEELKTTGGLVWRMFCVSTNQLIGESSNLSQSGQWETFSFKVVVPQEACDHQFLRLESFNRIALDLKISGTVYFDNLKITSANAPVNLIGDTQVIE